MARMAIDDSIARDPRITALALTLKISRVEAVGHLVSAVWPICYDQRTAVISERLIDLASGISGFAKAMIECELGRRDRSGRVRVAGAMERVQYLKDKIDAGRQGGLKSGESRRVKAKRTSEASEASRNPPDPVPDPVPVPDNLPDPVRERDARARAGALSASEWIPIAGGAAEAAIRDRGFEIDASSTIAKAFDHARGNRLHFADAFELDAWLAKWIRNERAQSRPHAMDVLRADDKRMRDEDAAPLTFAALVEGK